METQPADTQPPVASATTPSVHPNSKALAPLFFLLMLLCIGGGYWYWHEQQTASPQPDPTFPLATATPVGVLSSLTQPIAVEPILGSQPLDKRLFSDSHREQGIAIGYFEQKATANRPWLSTAQAADSQFATVLWYAKFVGGLLQVFKFDIATETEQQVTTATGADNEKPVFSSVSQRLAYSRNSAGDDETGTADLCETHIIDFAVSATQSAKTFRAEDQCYTPISWSPDGDKLVIEQFAKHLSRVSINPGNGISLTTNNSTFYIYSFAQDAYETFTVPKDIILCDFSNWTSDSQVLGECLDNGSGGVVYQYGLGDGVASEYALEHPYPQKIIPAAGSVFYKTRGQLGSSIAYVIAHGGSILEQSGPAYDFLVRYTQGTDEPTGLVLSIVRNEELFDIPQGIFTYDLTGTATTKRERKMEAYVGISFIGWLGDYDHVLYQAASGGSGATAEQYRVLNLETSEDSLLLQIPFTDLYRRSRAGS